MVAQEQPAALRKAVDLLLAQIASQS
jgi:hypothetical protein